MEVHVLTALTLTPATAHMATGGLPAPRVRAFRTSFQALSHYPW
jgi:hypothetical protein